jgi:U32 family peptidase
MAEKKEKEIGKVVHWYDKIGVAVIKLDGGLKIGDKVKVSRGETEFEEDISSMQLDHKPIEAGKKGQEIAIKFSQPAKDGARISKG